MSYSLYDAEIWGGGRGVYIVVVGFIGGGNWSTKRKIQTCRESLTNFITYAVWVYLTMSGIQIHNACKFNYYTIMTTIHYWNLQFPNNVIIIKMKVLLPQA